MSATPLHLDKTDAALQRLESAVARLEWALPSASPVPDLFSSEPLRKARQDYARLDSVTQQVESRIDQLVDRLQSLLQR